MKSRMNATMLAIIASLLPFYGAHASLFGSPSHGTPPALAAKLEKPVSKIVLTLLERASKNGLQLSVTPTHVDLKSINGPQVDTEGSRPGLLYIGADFCPYCAGQRWPLVLTLLRFGKITGLRYMLSSSDDVYPNTPTFTFQAAKYVSRYLNFRPVETATRHNKPLMRMSAAQKKIFNTYDAPPYTPVYGGIPFVYVAGEYMLSRPMLMPTQLSGKNWQQVAEELNNEQSNLFQSVMPQVNALTAAVCRLDGGDPDSVCSSPGVIAANGALLNLKPASNGG